MLSALNNASYPRLQKVLRYQAWLLVGLTILFVVFVRVRLREMPLERDEGEYAYAGQLMLQGVPPYSEAYTMKLPGTYAAYALIMAMFGQSASGIHLGLALVSVASILLMFLLGRKPRPGNTFSSAGQGLRTHMCIFPQTLYRKAIPR